jgi:hypothetical protein
MSNLNYNLDNYSKMDLFDMFDLNINNEFDKNELNDNYNKMLTSVKAEEGIVEDEKELLLEFLDKAFKNLLENDIDWKLTEGKFMPDTEQNEVFSNEKPIIKKKINKELRSFINPLKKVVITKTLCINSLFRKNYYNQRSTDFIVDLQEPLKNVTSMTLTNTDIPNNMYSFSSAIGTNEFTVETYDRTNNGNPENHKKHVVRIKNGNYTPNILMNYLNQYVFSPSTRDNNDLGDELKRIACYYDPLTKKISFFRDKRMDISGGFPDTANTKYYFNIDWMLSEKPNRSIQLNMGWILGFRKEYYSSEEDYITPDKVFYDTAEGYQAEACYQDNNGKRYIFLSIDDYNKNFAKSLISPFENSVINDINIFAKINNYYDSFNYSNGDVDYQFKRSYFGPVDIMKFRIRLLDEFGREIDLNNGDFSFTLRVEQLYDST